MPLQDCTRVSRQPQPSCMTSCGLVMRCYVACMAVCVWSAAQAIGDTPVDAEESSDVRDIPNRGVILIGENGPNANRRATQLQLPFGRKLKVPTVSVADGNVLCWAG